MNPTDPILTKKKYEPPKLEVHLWKFVTGGTTLPIGTLSRFDPLSDFFETEVQK
jgi:hypothetical protein